MKGALAIFSFETSFTIIVGKEYFIFVRAWFKNKKLHTN